MVRNRLSPLAVLCLVCWLAGSGRTNGQCVDYTDYVHRTGTLVHPGEVADLALDGSVCFGLDRTAGLRVFDIADPEQPLVIATLPLSGSLQRITLTGSLAVIAAGEAGIHVVDVTDPGAPNLVGSVATGLFAFDVTVTGDFAYVAAGSDDLYVIAVHPDAAPQVVAQLATPGFPVAVAASGQFVYLADGFSGLRVYDIGPSPEQPTVVAVLPSSGNVTRVATSGDQLALFEVGAGISLVSVAEPDQPVVLQTFGPTSTVNDIVLEESRAYVVGGPLRIYDLAGSASLLVEYDAGDSHRALAVTNQELVVLAVGRQTMLIHTANPSFVAPIAELPVEIGARDMVVAGDLAYLVDWEFLQIVDISDPLNLQARGRLDTVVRMRHVAILGNIVVIGLSEGGLVCVDVSDPDVPTVLSVFTDLWSIDDLVAANGLLYVLAYPDGLSVVDVSDPSSPVIVDQLDLGGYCLGVHDDVICVGQHDGVQVLDVSNPSAPQSIGWIDTPGNVYELTLDERWLYFVAGYPSLLHVVDLADPTIPVVRATLPVSYHALSFVIDGPYLYASIGDPASDLSLFDLSNPEEPRQLGEARVGQGSWAAYLRGDYLLLAGDEGLQILPRHCTDPTTAVIQPPTPTGSLLAARPNPFNPRTTLSFNLPFAAPVHLRVYDLAGRCLRTLAAGTVLAAGRHEWTWDGRTDGGRSMPSGVYLCRLEANAVSSTARLTLIR